MLLYLLVLTIVIGLPLSGFAQFVEKGESVQVAKGTKLCRIIIPDNSNGMLDPENRFWRVTSKARANGTQTVVAVVLETEYNRKSGDSTIRENQYDEDYAMFFKRSPEPDGTLLMISPQDGRVEATVGICGKKK